MKFKYAAYCFLIILIFGACSNHYSLQKRHYRKGFYFAHHHKSVVPINITQSKNQTNSKGIQQTITSGNPASPVIVDSTPCRIMHHPSEGITAQQLPSNNKAKNKTLIHILQKKSQNISENIDLPTNTKSQITHIFNLLNLESHQGGGKIFFDLLLIFIGIAAAGLFFFLYVLLAFTSSVGGGSITPTGKDKSLATLFFILAIACIIVPVVKLIKDL